MQAIIPTNQIETVERKIKAYNRKALKYDFAPATLSWGNRMPKQIHKHTILDGKEVKNQTLIIECIEITLEYPDTIKIGSFELVSVFDRFEEMVLSRTLPGAVLPEKYQGKTAIGCEHCNTRRKRNTSYLLYDGNQYIEVGKTCLQLYCGIDPQSFIHQASLTDIIDIINDMTDLETGGMSLNYLADLESYLTCTAACIQLYGWRSKSKSFDEGSMSTADFVYAMYYRGIDKDKITEQHEHTAKKTIEYFKNLDAQGNEYLTNCQKIANGGYVPTRYEGVACSMVAAYLRDIEKQTQSVSSEFLGTVGDRKVFENLTVKKVIFLEGWQYSSYLNIFHDANGNVLVWKSSNNQLFEIDQKINLTGTIKEHKDYKGLNQTILTRCKIKK